MTRRDLIEDCVGDVRTAEALVRHALSLAQELHLVSGQIDEALSTTQAHACGLALAPDAEPDPKRLAGLSDKADIVRQRCTLGSNLAARIEEHLDTASHALARAADNLDHAGRLDHPRVPAATHASLQARITHLSDLIGLAGHLARAARIDLDQATKTARQVAYPLLPEIDRGWAVYNVERTLAWTTRSHARADQAAEHLTHVIARAAARAAKAAPEAQYLAQQLEPPGPPVPSRPAQAPPGDGTGNHSTNGRPR